MSTQYDTRFSPSHLAGEDIDLASTELIPVAADGAERVRVDWRLVLAYLSVGVAALFLL
jgi:hypothetical protein